MMHIHTQIPQNWRTRTVLSFITRRLLWVLIGFTWLAAATDFRRGPLVNLSDPDPFINCPGGLPLPVDEAEEEPNVAVNPANPKNIVAVWIGGKAKGIVAAVTVDGGRKWQRVIIPGLNQCSGGLF